MAFDFGDALKALQLQQIALLQALVTEFETTTNNLATSTAITQALNAQITELKRSTEHVLFELQKHTQLLTQMRESYNSDQRGFEFR